MSAIKVLALCCLLSGTSACATVISGRTQTIALESIPSGAKVRYQGMTLGTTPCEVELARGGGKDLQFEIEGYETGLVSLDRRASGAFGNIPLFLLGIIPGYVGIVIDGITGSAFEFYPEAVKVELKRPAPGAAKTPARSAPASPASSAAAPVPAPAKAGPPVVKPPVPGEGGR